MRCNHENKMYPVKDNNGWVVGMLCDCGHFEFRKDMPVYDERLKQRMSEDQSRK